MEHLETLKAFLADPAVQSILGPLTQAFVAGIFAWKCLGVACAATRKMFASWKSNPAVVDAFTASLLDSLDGPRFLDTVCPKNAPSFTQVVTDNVVFRPYLTTVEHKGKPRQEKRVEITVDGRNVYDRIKTEADRKQVAKRAHEVHEQLIQERDEDERRCLAMAVTAPTPIPAPAQATCGCDAVSVCPEHQAMVVSGGEPQKMVKVTPSLAKAQLHPREWRGPGRKFPASVN